MSEETQPRQRALHASAWFRIPQHRWLVDDSPPHSCARPIIISCPPLAAGVEESGEGGGGYAREMSPAFIAAEMALFRAQAKEVDIVITTALIPGRPAPKLWLADMVESMKPGSVVVDMAAEAGGNCEATVPGQVVRTPNGVTVLGFTDLPSRLPGQASTLYASNLAKLLNVCFTSKPAGGAKDGPRELIVDASDDVVRMSVVTHGGAVMWPPAPLALPPPSPAAAKPVKKELTPEEQSA